MSDSPQSNPTLRPAEIQRVALHLGLELWLHPPQERQPSGVRLVLRSPPGSKPPPSSPVPLLVGSIPQPFVQFMNLRLQNGKTYFFVTRLLTW